MAQNAKSDKNVKESFKSFLVKKGYKIEKWDPDENNKEQCPADVFASKDGVFYLFEIKKTAQTTHYFGAATFTEWNAALNPPTNTRYFFVIAIEKSEKGKKTYAYYKIAPQTFMHYSVIPPFKIYFNINYKFNNDKIESIKLTRKKGSIIMSENVMRLLTCAMCFLEEHKNKSTISYESKDDFELME